MEASWPTGGGYVGSKLSANPPRVSRAARPSVSSSGTPGKGSQFSLSVAAPDAPFLCSAEEQPGNTESKHLGQQHLVITHLNEGGGGGTGAGSSEGKVGVGGCRERKEGFATSYVDE